MKKLTNCQYSEESQIPSKRTRFHKDNDGSDLFGTERRKSNETFENDNNNVSYNIGDDNEKDNNELNDNNNINDCGINDICEIENNEMEDDFNTSHLARWCKMLNVPTTHVNALLKDLRKHKCFKTVFPSDVRTLLGTSRFTPLKIVPPGEYYHQELINELVRVLSKYDNTMN